MRYFIYERKNICFELLLVAIFWAVWLAYGYPMEPVLYVTLIDLTAIIIIEGKRYFDRKEKRDELRKVAEDASVCLRTFPKPESTLEEWYQQAIKELDQRALAQQAVAEQKQLDMEHYYSMWSHQIKTPIAGIQLLMQEEEIDRTSIKRELHRIEQYVDTTLWYQRLVKTQNDFVLKEIDLEQVVKETLRRNVTLLMRQGLSIELNLKPLYVTSDKKWLGFVLEQVLSNAVKYTREGKVTVTVEEVDHKVLLIIEDTGIGIRPEDLPRIFDWGYTGINGHDNKKSTGIGLALCKEAIDKLGHLIYIDSKQGEGTKVTIEMRQGEVNVRD